MALFNTRPALKAPAVASLFAPETTNPGAKWAEPLSLFGAYLRDLGNGGATDNIGAVADSFAAKRQQTQQQAQFEAILGQAQAAGLSPLEIAVARMAGPGKFGENYSKEMATNRGFHDVTGGNTGLFGDPSKGGTVFTAPKQVEYQGVYGTQTPAGYVGTGQAAPSYEAITKQQDSAEAARRNAADEHLRQILADLEGNKLVETGRHNKVEEGIGWKSANRPAAGSDAGLPTGWSVRKQP